MKKIILLLLFASITIFMYADPDEIVLNNNGSGNDRSQIPVKVLYSDVIAGNSIDSNRTNGDVTVINGAEFEIEASGTVTLDDGFQVEKGATFAVYPPCF